MRKASMIIGIIGGVIAVIVALVTIAGAAAVKNIPSEFMDEFEAGYEEGMAEAGVEYDMDMDEYMMDAETAMNIGGNLAMLTGVALLIAGILGIVGGAIVKRSNVAAGIMMLVGAVISIITVVGFFSFLLLTLAGIFALVRDKSQNAFA